MWKRAVVVPVLVALALVGASVAAQPELIMKHARISRPGSGAHFFWQVATSPTNPGRVVACALRESAQTAHVIEAVIYGSSDAGETWQLLKSTAEFPANSEAACAMSGDSTVYFSMSLPRSGPGLVQEKKSGMYLWRSPDFGKTWKLSPRIPYADAALLLIKSNAAGRDRVFSVGNSNGDSEDRYLTIFDNNASRIRKIRSWNPAPAGPDVPLHCADHPVESQEWFSTAALPARPGECINGVSTMSTMDLGPGLIGALYTDWTLESPRVTQLTFTRLTEDGRPLGTSSVVAPLSTHQAAIAAIGDPFVGVLEPVATAGLLPNSSRMRVYAAWRDWVNGRVRVVLSISDDLGVTWSEPEIIDDLALRQHGGTDPNPTAVSLAVNKEGVLAASWVEFGGRCWRVAFSRDGGEHFGLSTAINPCDPNAQLALDDALAGHVFLLSGGNLRFDSHAGQGLIPRTSGFIINDFKTVFQGILRGTSLAAAQDGTFYALWSALGGRHDELHATSISFEGQESALSAQRKKIISHARCCLEPRGDAELYYTAFDFDSTTQEFEIDAVLARKRDFGGPWPLVLQVNKTESVLGDVRASNADNDLHDIGAAWVFDGPGSELPASAGSAAIKMLPAKQYEYSKPRRLRFKVNDNLHALAWRQPRESGGVGSNAGLVRVDLSLLSN